MLIKTVWSFTLKYKGFVSCHIWSEGETRTIVQRSCRRGEFAYKVALMLGNCNQLVIIKGKN